MWDSKWGIVTNAVTAVPVRTLSLLATELSG